MSRLVRRLAGLLKQFKALCGTPCKTSLQICGIGQALPNLVMEAVTALSDGLRLHDDVWLVSFMDYDLGYFDLGTRVREPLDNPFCPKLLAMS